MKHHQPVTSHHLTLFAKFAPYLIEVQPEQPHLNRALGSILSHFVSRHPYLHSLAEFPAYQTSPIDREDEPLFVLYEVIWNPFFTPPRFSSAYLERAHVILLQRDIKVSRLQQSLTTIAESFLAKQDEEVRRNPSRRVIPRHYFSQQPYAGHWYPIVGPHHVVPSANLVGCWINDSAIRALYKSTFHTIRKLTRGSRSLAKGNGYE